MSGKGYLSGMGFSLDEVLKKAALPEDLFARQTPSLTADFADLGMGLAAGGLFAMILTARKG